MWVKGVKSPEVSQWVSFLYPDTSWVGNKHPPPSIHLLQVRPCMGGGGALPTPCVAACLWLNSSWINETSWSRQHLLCSFITCITIHQYMAFTTRLLRKCLFFTHTCPYIECITGGKQKEPALDGRFPTGSDTFLCSFCPLWPWLYLWRHTQDNAAPSLTQFSVPAWFWPCESPSHPKMSELDGNLHIIWPSGFLKFSFP